MAISSRIPLPNRDQTFKDVMDYLNQMQARRQQQAQFQQELEMNEPLKKAQTNQAQASANKANALMNILMGTGQNEASSESSNGNGMPGKPGRMTVNQAMAASAALGFPTPPVVDGKIVTPFGTYQVGETKQQGRLGEAQKESSAQTLKQTAQNTLENIPVDASFQALDQLMKNPRYENIAGTFEGKAINSQPLGVPFGAWLQKNFPSKFSKEDANLAGLASGHMGNIVTGVASKFKGPFKDMVQGVINNMKPNLGDSIAVQQGKINALRALNDYANQINGFIAENVSSGRMNDTQAMLAAVKAFPFNNVMNKIESKLNTINSQHNMTTIDAKMIDIIDSNGKKHTILESNLPEARKRDPNLKVKQ